MINDNNIGAHCFVVGMPLFLLEPLRVPYVLVGAHWVLVGVPCYLASTWGRGSLSYAEDCCQGAANAAVTPRASIIQ